MKRYIYKAKRNYIAEIEYNGAMVSAEDVFNAYKECFPEADIEYDYKHLIGEAFVCLIYKEDCFEFVEK